MNVEPPPRPAGYHHKEEGTGAPFGALAFGQAGLAALALAQPHSTIEFLLGSVALPHTVEHERLAGLLAGSLISGAAASWALKEAGNNNDLDSSTSEALQLGLMGFGAALAGVHILHANDMTNNGLSAGVAAAALIFGVPAGRLLGTEKGRRRFGSRLRGFFDNTKRLFDFRPGRFKLSSAIYAALTPAFFAAGVSYLAAPGWTLSNFMGYLTAQRDGVFMWRTIGGGLLTILPAITTALKEKSDRDELDEGVPKTLNTALLLASIGHLAVLGPLYYDGTGGKYTPLVLAAWGSAGAASVLGLTSSATDRRL